MQQFKYLGHIITNGLTDDEDIGREIKNMFARTNILMRKFSKCSSSVKKYYLNRFVSVSMTLRCGSTITLAVGL